MTTIRESKVTLIRLLENSEINIPILVNLFQDDLYFEKKFLLADVDAYTAEDAALLFLCCSKTNYIVKSTSNLEKLTPLEFVEFFGFDSEDYFPFNEKAIANIKLSYERNVNANIELGKSRIIGFMCMMYYHNYIFFSGIDRIMTLRHDKNIITHHIIPQLDKSLVFMKNINDFSLSGNLYGECFADKFFFVKDFMFELSPFYKHVSLIGGKNTCIISIKGINRMYYNNELEKWEGIDTTLRTGLFVLLRTGFNDTKVVVIKENKALNQCNQIRDHEQYIKQRIEVLGLYNKLRRIIPSNVRYCRYLHHKIEFDL